MSQLKIFRDKYPLETAVIMGSEFKYRYLKNPENRETLVCLVGGIGLSDLGYRLVSEMSKYYSVITFDYSESYKTAAQLADAVSALVKQLGLVTYFFGQSLGGMLAQLIQKRHPEVVKGLILSNTGTLCSDLGQEGRDRFNAMMKKERKAYWLIKIMPFPFLMSIMIKGVEAKIKNNSEEEKEKMREFMQIMQELLTKKYELHMIRLLLDMENHLAMTKSDFASLNGRVMILSADDDETFNEDIKKTLENSMTNPVIKRFSKGGHMAPFFQFDTTVKYVREFIGK